MPQPFRQCLLANSINRDLHVSLVLCLLLSSSCLMLSLLMPMMIRVLKICASGRPKKDEHFDGFSHLGASHIFFLAYMSVTATHRAVLMPNKTFRSFDMFKCKSGVVLIGFLHNESQSYGKGYRTLYVLYKQWVLSQFKIAIGLIYSAVLDLVPFRYLVLQIVHCNHL